MGQSVLRLLQACKQYITAGRSTHNNLYNIQDVDNSQVAGIICCLRE